ncbi:ATP-binding protein [Acidobacteriota bacterium]
MLNNSCLSCMGTGWILESNEGRGVAKRCECYKKFRRMALFEQANIPKRYKNCTLKNFESEHHDSLRHALKISKKLVANYPAQDIGLLFQGPCGVGKTHLAVAIIHELITEKGIPCYFCDFRDLIRNIQKTYDFESPLSESDVLQPIFQKKVLVLDELGAKRTSAWVEETVFYIINQRYNNMKLTIFTSNYIDSGEEEEDTRASSFKKSEFNKQGDDTLVDRIGVRLRSRIYEMCKIVNMGEKDYRKVLKQGSYRF